MLNHPAAIHPRQGRGVTFLGFFEKNISICRPIITENRSTTAFPTFNGNSFNIIYLLNDL
jgi:hypothetical protein